MNSINVDMKKIFKIFIFINMLFLSSCNKDANLIYSNRIDILNTFDNLSIDKVGKYVDLTIYKDSLINNYVFEKKSILRDSLILITDSVQFNITKLNKEYLRNNNDLYQYIDYLLKKMKEYDIISINSDFRSHGVSLEIICQNYKIIFVPIMKDVKNSQWIEYINSANKLDDHWYWIKGLQSTR